MTNASIAISLVHIAVDDPDAALAFYRDALGLAVVNDVANDGFRWVTLATEGGPAIVLSQPHGGRSQEDGDALAALLAKGELAPLQFSTGDLAATFDKIAAAPGVEVLQEPTDQFWGVRDAAFRDPAGNLIRISQA
jgi:catechol 2,3-dioxygenase-like lactoylglutathione lyase family enzyme